MTYIKTFSNLENTPWLLATGDVANSVGVTASASTLQVQPSVECAFFALAPHAPFANAYWYKQLGADADLREFRYAAEFMFPSDADAAACQCLELDLQQVLPVGRIYNPGLQLDFADDKLRLWDRMTAAWFPVADIVRWVANTWHRVEFSASRVTDGVGYGVVRMDGLSLWVGGAVHVAKLDATIPPMLNVAVQLDGGASATPYRVMVRGVELVGRG